MKILSLILTAVLANLSLFSIAQQRKNFIITQCTIEKNAGVFERRFSDRETPYVNEISEMFSGENIEVIQLAPVNTSYYSSQLPRYKFNMTGFKFTLDYFPLGAKYVKFNNSEFLLMEMNWYKNEPVRYKSNFTLSVKEDNDILGPIIIKIIAVLDPNY